MTGRKTSTAGTSRVFVRLKISFGAKRAAFLYNLAIWQNFFGAKWLGYYLYHRHINKVRQKNIRRVKEIWTFSLNFVLSNFSSSSESTSVNRSKNFENQPKIVLNDQICDQMIYNNLTLYIDLRAKHKIWDFLIFPRHIWKSKQKTISCFCLASLYQLCSVVSLPLKSNSTIRACNKS